MKKNYLEDRSDKIDFKFLSEWNPLTSSFIPKTHVVTCFLQMRDKILILQRARKDQQYNLWGIPGGKLDAGELPLPGLIREIFEETKLNFSEKSFQLLGTALSKTPSDGQYGLYLYHAIVPKNAKVHINLNEHNEYRWVSLEDFQALDLLTAQREAFHWVETQLKNIMIHFLQPKTKVTSKEGDKHETSKLKWQPSM